MLNWTMSADWLLSPHLCRRQKSKGKKNQKSSLASTFQKSGAETDADGSKPQLDWNAGVCLKTFVVNILCRNYGKLDVY